MNAPVCISWPIYRVNEALGINESFVFRFPEVEANSDSGGWIGSGFWVFADASVRDSLSGLVSAVIVVCNRSYGRDINGKVQIIENHFTFLNVRCITLYL